VKDDARSAGEGEIISRKEEERKGKLRESTWPSSLDSVSNETKGQDAGALKECRLYAGRWGGSILSKKQNGKKKTEH